MAKKVQYGSKKDFQRIMATKGVERRSSNPRATKPRGVVGKAGSARSH